MRIDLPASLAKRVKSAAEASGESVEKLVGRALDEWLGDEASDARALQDLEEQLAAIDAGEPTVPHEEVARWLETWGTPSFRPWRSS